MDKKAKEGKSKGAQVSKKSEAIISPPF